MNHFLLVVTFVTSNQVVSRITNNTNILVATQRTKKTDDAEKNGVEVCLRTHRMCSAVKFFSYFVSSGLDGGRISGGSGLTRSDKEGNNASRLRQTPRTNTRTHQTGQAPLFPAYFRWGGDTIVQQAHD